MAHAGHLAECASLAERRKGPVTQQASSLEHHGKGPQSHSSLLLWSCWSPCNKSSLIKLEFSRDAPGMDLLSLSERTRL